MTGVKRFFYTEAGDECHEIFLHGFEDDMKKIKLKAKELSPN